ncbi:glutathione synthetase [Mesorhizobium sp. NFR06]|nr:glutathione synthetase [Mesorhizobium sp. NFR06]
MTFQLGRTDLSEMDVVLLRQDPPFDMNYITTTHILERIHPKTLVVNDPAWVRNSPEKIFVTEFPDLMPETLITKDPMEVAAFRKEFGDIIVKPLYGNGGAGIFHLHEADRNLASLLEMFGQLFREPYIVQRYLKDVRKGDKRIILIDGPALRERGFILVGIDVIGDYMTEINVTSPTGVREVQRFGGADIASLFWDCVEGKRG